MIFEGSIENHLYLFYRVRNDLVTCNAFVAEVSDRQK